MRQLANSPGVVPSSQKGAINRGPGRRPGRPAERGAHRYNATTKPSTSSIRCSTSSILCSPGGWEEHERDEEAERLERLLADRDLVTRPEYSGYADAEWEQVATEFARYGLSVMRSWIGKGTILAKLREKRLGGLPEAPPQWFDDEAVSDLAVDTVVAALQRFKDNVLMKHRWNPDRPGGAASLKTYLVGQCMFQFRIVYRRWYGGERGRRRHVIAAEPGLLDRPGPGRDVVTASIRSRYRSAASRTCPLAGRADGRWLGSPTPAGAQLL